MKLVNSRFQAMPPAKDRSGDGFADQTLEAELADLSTALKRAKVPSEEREQISKAHRTAREKLKKYVSGTNWDNRGADTDEPQTLPPPFPHIEVASGLPE